MTPRWPNIDDIDIVELLTTTELVPDADMPRPTDGPHVVERIRLPLDTWQLVEAEAQAPWDRATRADGPAHHGSPVA
jgi:hypothetical protein